MPALDFMLRCAVHIPAQITNPAIGRQDRRVSAGLVGVIAPPQWAHPCLDVNRLEMASWQKSAAR